MEATSLIKQNLKAVWLYPSWPIHPAWKNELTTSICGSEAILELTTGRFVAVRPCEVTLSDDRYPALGLELVLCTRTELRTEQMDGRIIEAVPLQDVSALLPHAITGIEESDPLEEGAVSQYSLALGTTRIVFRHIMPPTTLGILIE